MKKYLVLVLLATLFACSDSNTTTTSSQNESTPAKDLSSSSLDQSPEAGLKVSVKDVLWEEGKHFAVLDHDATSSPEIKEFFSFYCPHCYNFEPFVEGIKRHFGKKVPLDKVHVDFMGGASRDIQRQLSAAMVFARHLGKEAQINRAIFEHIHLNKKRLDNTAQLVAILRDNGISEAEFTSALTKPDLVDLFKAHEQKLTQYQQDISGVPTFVVNGKYKVLFGQNLNAEELLSLIEWLANKSS